MSLDAVAIDGPAGAGKSTIARGAAARLGFLYVDTGAMYRAVALAAVRRNLPLEDADALGALARAARLDFDPTGTRVLWDGEDVTASIRTPEITGLTRHAAHARPVRDALVARQRAMARERPVVMEGRDITTVVLPEARWRFFVTASIEARARRRFAELAAGGHTVDLDRLRADIEARDRSDNEVGPLKEARESALAGDRGIHFLDTTELGPEEVVERILTVVARSGVV